MWRAVLRAASGRMTTMSSTSPYFQRRSTRSRTVAGSHDGNTNINTKVSLSQKSGDRKVQSNAVAAPKMKSKQRKRPHVVVQYEEEEKEEEEEKTGMKLVEKAGKNRKERKVVGKSKKKISSTDKDKPTTSVAHLETAKREGKSSSKNEKSGGGEDILKSDGGKWEPHKWRETLDHIREMRKDKDAPVDSMGAEKICDKEASPKVRFYIQIRD